MDARHGCAASGQILVNPPLINTFLSNESVGDSLPGRTSATMRARKSHVQEKRRQE
jgi:hypothetical protein